jgi:hypothetical protein
MSTIYLNNSDTYALFSKILYGTSNTNYWTYVNWTTFLKNIFISDDLFLEVYGIFNPALKSPDMGIFNKHDVTIFTFIALAPCSLVYTSTQNGLDLNLKIFSSQVLIEDIIDYFKEETSKSSVIDWFKIKSQHFGYSSSAIPMQPPRRSLFFNVYEMDIDDIITNASLYFNTKCSEDTNNDILEFVDKACIVPTNNPWIIWVIYFISCVEPLASNWFMIYEVISKWESDNICSILSAKTVHDHTYWKDMYLLFKKEIDGCLLPFTDFDTFDTRLRVSIDPLLYTNLENDPILNKYLAFLVSTQQNWNMLLNDLDFSSDDTFRWCIFETNKLYVSGSNKETDYYMKDIYKLCENMFKCIDYNIRNSDD